MGWVAQSAKLKHDFFMCLGGFKLRYLDIGWTLYFIVKLSAGVFELHHWVLVVDSKATNIDRLLLIKLDHLCGSTHVNYKFKVFDHLSESLNDSFLFICIAFQLVELLPSILCKLQVKFLKTADLGKLLNFASLHVVL